MSACHELRACNSQQASMKWSSPPKLSSWPVLHNICAPYYKPAGTFAPARLHNLYGKFRQSFVAQASGSVMYGVVSTISTVILTQLLLNYLWCSAQVDWSQRPRSLGEFFAKVSLPESRKKLETRLKCNLYYYRANYFLLLLTALLLAFLRKPTAILATAAALLGGLCLNNTFATSLR